MMKCVYFDNIHSYDDLGLILSSVVVEPPEVKTKKIDVPGSDGVIDLTQFDGDIHYNNRKISLTFTAKGITYNWASVFSEVNNKLHGKEMNIVLSDDPNFMWHGRVSVKSHTKASTNGKIEIEVDAEPYKYTKMSSVEDVEWDTFDFNNGIMQNLNDIAIDGDRVVSVYGYSSKAVPVIEVTGTMSVTYNGITTVLEEGKNKVLYIIIKEGVNTLSFSGNGKVSIEFRGGSL